MSVATAVPEPALEFLDAAVSPSGCSTASILTERHPSGSGGDLSHVPAFKFWWGKGCDSISGTSCTVNVNKVRSVATFNLVLGL